MSDFFDAAASTWDTKHQRVAQAEVKKPFRTMASNARKFSSYFSIPV